MKTGWMIHNHSQEIRNIRWLCLDHQFDSGWLSIRDCVSLTFSFIPRLVCLLPSNLISCVWLVLLFFQPLWILFQPFGSDLQSVVFHKAGLWESLSYLKESLIPSMWIIWIPLSNHENLQSEHGNFSSTTSLLLDRLMFQLSLVQRMLDGWNRHTK